MITYDATGDSIVEDIFVIDLEVSAVGGVVPLFAGTELGHRAQARGGFLSGGGRHHIGWHTVTRTDGNVGAAHWDIKTNLRV